MEIRNLLWRNFTWRLRNSFTLIISGVQPFIWLFFYSTLFRNPQIEHYTTFIFPGIIVLLIFSCCGVSGFTTYMMREKGSFYRIHISSVKRSSILIAHILDTIIFCIIDIILLSIFASFLGVRMHTGLAGIMLILSLIVLCACFMSAFSYTFSFLLPNENVFQTIMNTIVLPIFFVSTALFPASQISPSFQNIVRLNPFSYIIDSIRNMMMDNSISWSLYANAFIIMAVLCTICYTWALHRLHHLQK